MAGGRGSIQTGGLTGQGTLARVPPHLRHLIVQQDYSRYTAIDQAVWRFVLLQAHARLAATAHPAYARGLGQSGISVERIPRIEEMDAMLAPLGWGCVCVDGFIPPRAFQELQSLSILPVAADMRSAEHLVYTPAPDIIHEAAGHAPILPEPTYAAYLRRIGAAGARAFTLPEDTRVDRAIHALSEIKEAVSASAAEVERAERALAEAYAGVTRTSEAARLSRLYWWTAEYGLVGTPRDYKLYGAGLLSSLWESLSCHDPRVAKLLLTASAGGVDYDVTRPQPQLFVTPSFEHLHDVLDAVVSELPSVRGGEDAIAEALAAAEISTVTLEGGLVIHGVLGQRLTAGDRSSLLGFRGRARAELGGVRAELSGVEAESIGLYALLGHAGQLSRELSAGQFALSLPSGARVRGEARLVQRGPGDAAAIIVVERGELSLGTDLHDVLAPGQVVVLAPRALGAHAGAPSDFFPSTELPDTRVPKAHSIPPREHALLALYESALGALRAALGADVVPVFERVHAQLVTSFPHDWLLRWNLLESLYKLGAPGPLAEALHQELSQLEAHYGYRQPIASGLSYLSRWASAGS